ncbi:cell surface hydrolase [Streptococcus sanguinis SK49]|uniref:Cell surface hydrolase n=1 Tax=Streptococcus sanguinis SK49 TaxID=888808 RepID=F3UXR1_STRSA|nr:alpha/beta hydrolase [Streptococcus sanguinis]EGJ38700.1 cell surface hydrolase [Streptococcus sanguinis SK49]
MNYFTALFLKINTLINNLVARSIKHLPASKQSIEPIIMIPGSSATENRFNLMVKKLNRNQHSRHSLVRIKVWNDGHMTYRGHLKRKDRNPIFVVGFQNNRDGYENIKKQAAMFDTALTVLREKYSFNSFKALGHSNGGLIYTVFLQQYLANHSGLEMEKLLTIGSPYNLNKKNINHRVAMLDDFISNQENLPKKLQHLSILGIFFRDGDGIVHKSSVEAGSLIYKRKIASHREVVIVGKDAHHSSLPQNEQVVVLIKEFLF